jgi:hypothetical protein
MAEVDLDQPGARLPLKVAQSRRQVGSNGIGDGFHKVAGSHGVMAIYQVSQIMQKTPDLANGIFAHTYKAAYHAAL